MEEGEHLQRELNEQDDLDNLDLQYDKQNEIFDHEKFTSELLFAVQGLGSNKFVNQIEIYVKGDHCEESIKDLIRFTRKDDQEEPITRKKLGLWHTFENDIIQLLLTQYQDKKLAFYLILLMVNLTEPVSKNCVFLQEMKDILIEYKLSFLKPQVIGTLMHHLGDCIQVGEQKAHKQMIELIVILIRNILFIEDKDNLNREMVNNELKRNLHYHLILQLKRDFVFDILTNLTENKGILQKLDVQFLEIFYFVFACFDPEWFLDDSGKDKEFLRLLDKDRNWKKKIQGSIPVRHSRFYQNFSYQRLFGDTRKILDNPFVGQGGLQGKKMEVNFAQKQLQQSVPRKFLRSQEGIFPKKLHFELNVEIPVHDEGLGGDFMKLELVSFKKIVKELAFEFIKYSFCPLIEQCYNLVYANSEKLEEYDIIYYFVLIAFGLKIVRLNIYQYKNNELELGDIAASLQLTQFQLIFSKIVQQVTNNKKKDFNIKIFYASINCFLELILLIKEMNLDSSQKTRQNAQILMQNIFHHDIIKALRIGFEFCKKGLLEDQILKCLLRLIIGFFDLLEGFSKGKVLTLQTNKQVRKKKKKEKKNAKRKTQQQEVEELNDFIEKDEQDDEEGDFLPDGQKQKKKKKIEESQEQESQIQHENQEDEDDEEDEDEDEDDDTPQFQERKYTLQSEFAMLADYSIIDKVLYLINDEKILYNSPEVNESVFKYLNKIQTLLQAEWLFYQVDFLWVIQSVLSNKEVNMRIEHKKLVDFFKKIVNKLFVKIEENKLLVVEMLFRFTDFQLKNSILSNYQDIESKQNNELIETALEDDNDILEEQQIRESKKWTEVEDRALIYNYETFKNLENCYEQLCLILNGFRSYDKQPLDVKKRIKYFKLHKNKFTAEAIFKDIYQNSKVSVEKAIYKLIKMIQNKDEYKINFTLDEFKLFIEQIFINFKEYLFYFEEEFQQYTEIEKMSLIQDFAIIPFTQKDFDILYNVQVQEILESINFRRPCQGQIYWRVPNYLKIGDLEILSEKIQASYEYKESENQTFEEQEIQQNNSIQEYHEISDKKYNEEQISQDNNYLEEGQVELEEKNDHKNKYIQQEYSQQSGSAIKHNNNQTKSYSHMEEEDQQENYSSIFQD